MLDKDQYVVKNILHYYTDNPFLRTTLGFLVEYMDGDKIWQQYSLFLFGCEAYVNTFADA